MEHKEKYKKVVEILSQIENIEEDREAYEDLNILTNVKVLLEELNNRELLKKFNKIIDEEVFN